MKKSIKVSVQEETSHIEPQIKNLWAELRIKQNISARSYHSTVLYNSQLFIYGGYEANTGILSDFHSLNLASDIGFEFIPESHNGQYPGALHRHSAIVWEKYMYIFGGKQSIFENSNKLFRYSFEEKTWELIESLEINDDFPPCLDSHSAVLSKNSENEDEMLVFGGFMGGKIGKYSRNIYNYSFKNNKWDLFFDGKSKNLVKTEYLKKRSSAGMIIYEGGLYVFGGTNSKIKFDDLWRFDLNKRIWSLIKTNEETPLARCGHLMFIIKEKIFIFGGIHDIAHEKNDLYCFNISLSKWNKIDSDFTETLKFPEKNLMKNSENKPLQNKSKVHLTPKTISNVNTIPTKMPFLTPKGHAHISFKLSKSSKSRSKSPKRNSILLTNKIEQPKSPHQIRDERLKQQFLEKKQQLLAEFEIDNEDDRQILNSPTTETMKKSINSLNLNTKNHQEKKENIFLKDGGGNHPGFVLKDRKPCARDGCSANLYNNKLIIFGGDRHNMTFKDMYWLDLEKII